MDLATVTDPFALEDVPDVRLARSPLEVVLFQVRLVGAYTPLQDAIENGRLQSALSGPFPFAQTRNVVELVIQPGGPAEQKVTNARSLHMSDSTQKWSLNILRDSFGLTTTAYTSRLEMLEKSIEVFRAIAEIAGSPRVARVGMRYINRISDLSDLVTLVERGGLTADIVPMQELWLSRLGAVPFSMNELLHAWPSTAVKLQARWGLMPPGTMLDPGIRPLEGPSWVLDIDSFDEVHRDFAPGELGDVLDGLARKAYRFFRWVFTPEGLNHFGVVE